MLVEEEIGAEEVDPVEEGQNKGWCIHSESPTVSDRPRFHLYIFLSGLEKPPELKRVWMDAASVMKEIWA